MNKFLELIHKEDIYEGFQPWPVEIDYSASICNGGLKENLLSLIKHKSPIIIEVGTWKGASAIEMAKHFKSNGQNPTIFCVDTWNGSGFHKENDFWHKQLKCKHGYPQIYYQFLSNVVHFGMQENIVPVPLNTWDAARFLKDLGIVADICYVDACHEYEDVKKDIEIYYKMVKNDGILFGDDYDPGWLGVVRAVNEFIAENNLANKFKLIESQWIINKNNE